jgi:hypothetical protein
LPLRAGTTHESNIAGGVTSHAQGSMPDVIYFFFFRRMDTIRVERRRLPPRPLRIRETGSASCPPPNLPYGPTGTMTGTFFH